MNLQAQLLLIAGMAAVTYIPRMAPLLMLASRSPHPNLLRFLEMIPPAVLAALLAPELLLHTGEHGPELFFSSANVFLPAALPTILVGVLRRNFFGTVATGMAAVALIRLLQAPPQTMSILHSLLFTVLFTLPVGILRRNIFVVLGTGILVFGLLRMYMG